MFFLEPKTKMEASICKNIDNPPKKKTIIAVIFPAAHAASIVTESHYQSVFEKRQENCK